MKFFETLKQRSLTLVEIQEEVQATCKGVRKL